MINWKEDAIVECIRLQEQRKAIQDLRAKDTQISILQTQKKELEEDIAALDKGYLNSIERVDSFIEEQRNLLVAKWDITDKTYECDLGSATLRTTKSLNIVDKKGLIDALLKLEKLPEAIRTWNLSYLRKLKDVDMIEDKVAYYDEHQNVIIKEVR
jgi:hypothetical protein